MGIGRGEVNGKIAKLRSRPREVSPRDLVHPEDVNLANFQNCISQSLKYISYWLFIYL